MNYGMSVSADTYRPELFWQGEHLALTPPVDHMVDAARLGDDRAFGNLVEVYRSAAERLAQQILHTEEAAADAVQEALIKAHRAMGRFQDGNFRQPCFRCLNGIADGMIAFGCRRCSFPQFVGTADFLLL